MISAIILSKDEEKNIARCLNSVSWCDEIILIDDYSRDKTVQIAKKYKAKIYKRHLNGNFAAQRNFGLSKAKNKWVLFIDADEVLSGKFLPHDKYEGYFIKRQDYFLGKKMSYSEAGNIKLLRLGKKGSGIWKRKVHEYWDIKSNVGNIEIFFVHYPHPSLREFIDDINRYSSIHTTENIKEGKQVNLFKIIFYPLAKFVKNYFYNLGFLDGTRGFIMAVFMSFHSFLSWSKAWTS